MDSMSAFIMGEENIIKPVLDRIDAALAEDDR